MDLEDDLLQLKEEMIKERAEARAQKAKLRAKIVSNWQGLQLHARTVCNKILKSTFSFLFAMSYSANSSVILFLISIKCLYCFQSPEKLKPLKFTAVAIFDTNSALRRVDHT